MINKSDKRVLVERSRGESWEEERESQIFPGTEGVAFMFFEVSDKVVFREIDDKIVLINLDTGFYYSLNELGRFIFNEILKRQEIGDIVDEIRDTYEVPEQEAREDLQEFLRSLEAEKILVQQR